MQTSIFLAKLIGPILLVAGIGVLINRKSFDLMVGEFLSGHALRLLLGLIELAVGLAIVLAHNVWAADWRVLITLLGWLLLIRGAARVLVPERIKTVGTKFLKNPNAMTASLAITTLIGLVLCYFGYTR